MNKYLKLKGKLEIIESKLSQSYDERRKSQEKEAIQKMRKDPRTFFSFAKKFSKAKTDVGPFLDEEGNLVTNTENIAEMLKAQYESVFSHPVPAKVISDPENFFKSSDADEQLDNVIFNRDDVIEALDKLSTNAAPGPDGIPALYLKSASTVLLIH